MYQYIYFGFPIYMDLKCILPVAKVYTLIKKTHSTQIQIKWSTAS